MEQNPQGAAETNSERISGGGGPASARDRVRHFGRRLSPGWFFTAVALLLWLRVHGDFGITSDEPIQSAYGEVVWNYLAGHLSYQEFNTSPTVPDNIYYYGPALDLFCSTLAHALNADIYSVRHGVQGLMWAALFLPVCALGRRIAGRPGAWFAGLALLGMPSLFGQGFNNPKDLPLACAAIWLLATSASVAASRRLDWRGALKLGGALGFVLAMRPGAWFLGVLIGLVPLVLALRAWKLRHGFRHAPAKIFSQAGPVLLFAVIMGWLMMILPWPNAWHSPLGHPVHSARLAAHFDEVYPVLLRGTIYHSNHLPWDYLASYLVLTLPLPFLFFAVWGHLVLWRKRSGAFSRAATILGVCFLIWFPLVVFVALRPNIYDGMRHFLFMLPPIAVLVGVAAADLTRRSSGWTVKLAVGLLLLSAVPAMIRLHPYESVYYNVLAGPSATLHERYETDYWFSSYSEAAAWINRAQSKTNRPLRVLVVAGQFNYPVFTHGLNPKTEASLVRSRDLTAASLSPNFDYYVGTERYGQWLNFSNSPIVCRFERDGILFSVIRGSPH
jgi:hypothetical protein